jgi:hydroxyacylglutathione hydrolase
MYIEQLYTNCLSEAAYYIESEGKAAVIDPLRDVEVYTQLAQKRNAVIQYIFETHFHADFVSGHLDLSRETGAPIVYGPDTKAGFKAHIARDGEIFKIGAVTLEALHTPGHTLESTCFLLRDESSKPHAVFTGDTLFVGDVGRPDLAQKENELTTEGLAGMLYDSLQAKIIPLADEVLVYPAHGPGSNCGKSLGKETYSTIGEQKQHNYALQPQTKEQFIQAVTEGLNAPPSYFPVNARINREGYDSMENIMEKALQGFSVADFKKLAAEDGAIILDTRPADVFTPGFVPGSIFIGLEGRLAEWAGSLLPFDKKILLVTEPGKEKESAVRLARVGFDKMQGYLEGGYEAWVKAGEKTDMIIDIEADELAMDIPFDENLLLVDVRKEAEFADGHVKDAVNVPLHTLNDPGSMADFEDTDNIYVHCAGGYRSVIAASILKKEGIHNLRNVLGGYNAIRQQSGIKTEKSVEVLN